MTLNRPEQMLLQAISAAVRDEHVAWTEAIPAADWQAFWHLAMTHNVLPMVYEAVYNCDSAAAEPLTAAYRPQALRQVTVQTVKTRDFLALYDALTAQGFHPLVVKGIVCRALYPHGDYRTSSDEDLLIPADEWERCCQALGQYGMAPQGDDDPKQHEIGWTKEWLYIELHRSLFPPESDAYGALNDLFPCAHERAADYPVEDGKTVRSLSPHDHLLYLLLHACKHFIHSGFGIRQVCDIGLWAVRYGGDVDWDRLYDQCAAAHALSFSAAVFWIARECLGVDPALPGKWADISVDPEPLLHDLLRGGVYGASDKNRLHAAAVTVNAVAASRQHKRTSVLAAVFPPRRKLLGQYPELKAHPGRLPLVWVKRLVKYAGETHREENNRTGETLRVARERTELLRQYGIME